jgi:hypothetical protein
MVLRCTARLLGLLGVRRGELAIIAPARDDWYANLLWIERRKCLLLTHADTAFAVFVADVRARDVRPFGPYACRLIGEALAAEGLPADALGQLDGGAARLAATASRRVLGYMNDIALHVERVVAASGGLARTDAASVNQRLQRTLHDHDGAYQDPLERIRERAGAPTPTARRPTAPAAAPTTALRLRVDLGGMPKPVWRRLTVPAGASLADLAESLVVAFDWHGDHLAGFWTDRPWRGRSYVSRDQIDEHGDDGEPTDTVSVGELLGRVGDTLYWIYDYGDGWTHRLATEALVADADDRIHCTDGRNAAPPEDCGGPAGYEQLLSAIADPDHPEHDEFRDWLGAPFDPASFDHATIDEQLATIPVRSGPGADCGAA